MQTYDESNPVAARTAPERTSLPGIEGAISIVTGGGSGIGRATAKRFAAEGATVVVADILEDEGTETVDDIVDDEGEAIFVTTDVSDEQAVEGMVETAVSEYGGLDFAFNNAGVEGTSALTTDQDLEGWNRVIDINLKGVWLGMKYQIPHILENGGGAIVNTASVAGLAGFGELGPYTASKHGVIGLTRTAALEYSAKGVRVNAVCPGVIDTPMVQRTFKDNPDAIEALTAAEPIGRLGQPEEIASAVIWLCSDDASFVTGHPLVVDGGYIAQ